MRWGLTRTSAQAPSLLLLRVFHNVGNQGIRVAPIGWLGAGTALLYLRRHLFERIHPKPLKRTRELVLSIDVGQSLRIRRLEGINVERSLSTTNWHEWGQFVLLPHSRSPVRSRASLHRRQFVVNFAHVVCEAWIPLAFPRRDFCHRRTQNSGVVDICWQVQRLAQTASRLSTPLLHCLPHRLCRAGSLLCHLYPPAAA